MQLILNSSIFNLNNFYMKCVIKLVIWGGFFLLNKAIQTIIIKKKSQRQDTSLLANSKPKMIFFLSDVIYLANYKENTSKNKRNRLNTARKEENTQKIQRLIFIVVLWVKSTGLSRDKTVTLKDVPTANSTISELMWTRMVHKTAGFGPYTDIHLLENYRNIMYNVVYSFQEVGTNGC